jgi:adenylate cyclase
VRVHRSFAFIDLSGFTALTEKDGDEHAVRVLGALRALLRDICSRRGIRIAKWLGDGAMLVCVETTPLLAGIIELHYVVDAVTEPDQFIGIRSGVTSGAVILMEGDDYIGHCVNVAARLCDVAQSGDALADPSVLDALPRWGAVLSTQEVILRGVEKPLPVARLGFSRLAGPVISDPVCGIPLPRALAESAARDPGGVEVLFCSDSCRDTWERRPLLGAGAGAFSRAGFSIPGAAPQR